MKFQKSEKQSAIITSVITALLLLFLIIFGMTAVKNEIDEGVMVSFGAEGFGEAMPSPPPTTSPEPTTTATATPTPQPEDPLLTQEDPSVAIDEEEKRKEQERNEQMAEERRKAEEERKRQEEERIAEEKRLEEQRIRQEKADAARKLTGSAFQNKGDGSGNTSGASQQGNPAGLGKSPEGVTGLNGRSLVSNKGKLIEPPYSGSQQGRVVVDIVVDVNGVVTSATINVGKTVGITDETLRRQSLEAAKKNRFSTVKGSAVARGTITFTYKIR